MNEKGAWPKLEARLLVASTTARTLLVDRGQLGLKPVMLNAVQRAKRDNPYIFIDHMCTAQALVLAVPE